MGESNLTIDLRSEAELIDFSGRVARALREAERFPLVIALRGDLGAGKTTWARAALRALGHAGRVPSPTYTLLEHYDAGGLVVVHLDLYRLASEAELENLGLRDWLEKPATWVLFEWPERAPGLLARSDLEIAIEDVGEGARRVSLHGRSRGGIEALRVISQLPYNYAR
jgi:tRNA threonylcarbamoyladenosine biosynthesis protein TsaE